MAYTDFAKSSVVAPLLTRPEGSYKSPAIESATYTYEGTNAFGKYPSITDNPTDRPIHPGRYDLVVTIPPTGSQGNWKAGSFKIPIMVKDLEFSILRNPLIGPVSDTNPYKYDPATYFVDWYTDSSIAAPADGFIVKLNVASWTDSSTAYASGVTAFQTFIAALKAANGKKVYLDFTGSSAVTSFPGFGTGGDATQGFMNVTNLTGITLPPTAFTVITNTTTNVGDFWGCTGLKVINTGGATAIPTNAFPTYGTNTPPTRIPLERVTLNANLTTTPFAGLSTLKEVTLGTSATSVAANAFEDCKALTDVTFLSTAVTTIAGEAFKNTNISKLDVTMSSGTISPLAFSNCNNLSEVSLKGSMSSITSWANAFEEIMSLKTVTLGSGITAIANAAFKGCVGLQTLKYEATALDTIGSSAFEGCKYLKSDVNINTSTGTMMLGTSAFKGTESLTTVTLIGSQASIPESCFEESGITGLTLPATVLVIDDKAFKGCKNLTSIDLANVTGAGSKIGDEAFAGSGLKGTSTAKIIVPTGVVTFGDGVFKGCGDLAYVSYGYTGVPASTFADCGKLVDLTYKVAVGTVEANAFSNVPGQVTMTFEAGITTPGFSFIDQRSIKKLVILNNGTPLTAFMFRNCVNLDTVTVGVDLGGTFTADVFPGCTKLTTLEITADQATGSTFASAPDTITNVIVGVEDEAGKQLVGAANTLLFNKAVKNITFLGTSISAIEPDQYTAAVPPVASAGLANLSGVTLNINIDGLLGNGAAYLLQSRNAISKIVIGPKVTTIASSAFLYNTNLATIEVNGNSSWYATGGVLYTGNRETLHTYPPKKVVRGVAPDIISNVINIGAYVFADIADLTVINLPVNVKTLGSLAFVGTNIEKVTLNSSLTSIQGKDFNVSVNSLILGSNVGSLPVNSGGDGLFEDCTLITEVDFPASIVSIGDGIFAGCTNLTTITIRSGTGGIGAAAFPNAKVVTFYSDSVKMELNSFGSGSETTTLRSVYNLAPDNGRSGTYKLNAAGTDWEKVS
jgi:hypothetical protein